MNVRPPERPEEIFEDVLADLRAALGDDLLGLTLYGSAAGGGYVPGQSDLNFMILAADLAHSPASRLIPFVKKWRKANLAPPLLLSPALVRGSLDTYPIEFLVMSRSYKPVWGLDPLAGIEINPADLRLQLERELKGKTTLLRTRLMISLGDREALLVLASEALPAFTALFQAYLELTSGGFPGRPDEVLKTLDNRKIKVQSFLRLSQLRHGKAKLPAGAMLTLWEEAIRELAALAEEVDKLDVQHKE